MPSALILGKHYLSVCDTPYHYGKGKIMELNNLLARDYLGLFNLGGNVCSLVYILLVDVIQHHILMINTHVAQTGDEEDI